MNLVAGATGLVGGEVCRLLAEKGKPVRALVRPTSDRKRLETLRGLGAELVEGDLKDRRSLEAACRGVKAVVSTATSMGTQSGSDTIETADRDGQLNLVEAARSAGVEQFVFVSFRPSPDLDYPLQSAKLAVERRLQEIGLDYTVLRASLFMEVWLSPRLGFDAAGRSARIYGKGENKISWISFADVAHFCAATLDVPATRKTVLEIGGPGALSPLEVVRIFEEEGGKKFTVEHVPEAALRAQWEGAADPLSKTFAGLMLMYSRGDAMDMRRPLELMPAKLLSAREYARRVYAG